RDLTGEPWLPPGLLVQAAGADGGRLGGQPGEQQRALAVRAVDPNESPERVADGGERRLARRPGHERGPDLLADAIGEVEDDVFLGVEVAEERAAGDFDLLDDIVDGRGLETTLGEERERSLGELRPDPQLLPFAQPLRGDRWHEHEHGA